MTLTPNDILNDFKKYVSGNKKIFKVTIFGDSGVGKTSLIRRFADAKFDKNYSMTIGGEFATKNIPISSHKEITLLFSDVAGQKRFEETNEVFFAGAEICLAVFDLTREQSLNNLFKNWIPRFVRTIAPGTQPKLQIVGNKSDLTDLIVIGLRDIEEIASKISVRFPQISLLKPFLITSAKFNRYETEAFFS